MSRWDPASGATPTVGEVLPHAVARRMTAPTPIAAALAADLPVRCSSWLPCGASSGRVGVGDHRRGRGFPPTVRRLSAVRLAGRKAAERSRRATGPAGAYARRRGEGHGVPCPGAARGVASWRAPAARLVQAALVARAAAHPRQPGDRGGPDHRRALGRRRWPRTTTTRSGCTSPSCAPCSSPTASGAPKAGCWRRDLPATPSPSAPTSSTRRASSAWSRKAAGCSTSNRRVAAVVLGEALGLWRGRPYEDFTYESFAQAEILRLDELRLETVELRIDADLRRGLAGELVGELQALVRQHPFRERFTAQLMLALHRSGRRAEALRSYAHLRSTLGDELGLDPSTELQALEHQILTSAPELDRPTPANADGRRSAIRGYELREPTGTNALGRTYRAYQAAEGREVSITVVPPERANDVAFIRRMQIDPEVMANLTHPNILTVEDFWRDPDGAYVVTRVFGGGTLAAAVSAGSLSSDAATSVAADVDAALAAARDRGFVHGPVDPASVLVEDGHGFVHGFGFVPVSLQETVGQPALDGAPSSSATRPPAVAAASDVMSNPYKGLEAFGEADAGDFFGRERVVERLLARLGTIGSAGRFVAVVGPSGSGKSSVVKAGLLPAIRQRCSARFRRVVRRPDGPQPAALRRAGRRAAHDRRRSQDRPARSPDRGSRRSRPVAAGGPPRRPVAAAARGRPVRGALHTDGPVRLSRVPGCAHQRGAGTAQSPPAGHHPAGRLLRPPVGSPCLRRAPPVGHRADHGDVAGRAPAGHRGPGGRGRRRLRARPGRRHRGGCRRSRRRAAAAASTR